MEVDSSTAQPSITQPAASSQLCTHSLNGQAERQAERQEWQDNGNIPPWPSEQKKIGARVDELCAKLAIKHVEQKDSGANAIYYYCIGSDSCCTNNSRSRALPHAKACHVCIISSHFTVRDFRYSFCLSTDHQTLQRKWPNEWKAVNDALIEMTTEQAVTGQAKAPAVREPSKQKATNQNAGRVKTSFAPPDSLEASSTATSESSSATVQSKLSQSWGESKLTAAHQTIINFNLLRFIVCCSIAFAVLDNGFFIDFVSALWVTTIFFIQRLENYHDVDVLDMLCLTGPTSSVRILLRKLLLLLARLQPTLPPLFILHSRLMDDPAKGMMKFTQCISLLCYSALSLLKG
jgi:hypothetical protein